MNFLGGYNEKKIGHYLIQKSKSCFLMGSSASSARASSVAACTGFIQKSFPIKYLGSNFFIGRKKIVYFQDLVSRLKRRLWGENVSFYLKVAGY